MGFLKRMMVITAILCMALPSVAGAQLLQPRVIILSRAMTISSLSKQITEKLKSDSEKVRAIHDWVVTNIRYNVKEMLSDDDKYESTTIKKVLWKKKAICEGYSQLFAELCFYAGINCVVVHGYDKNIQYNTDNNFYFDEHSWNAVQVEGGWKLVDACWDAGAVVFTQRTAKGFFVHMFTGGHRDDQRYKPHFVKKPSEFYCLRDGNFFKTDHIPLNPIWQLTDNPEPIQQYVKDSSFYYKKYDGSQISADSASKLEAKRKAYLLKNDLERDIEDETAGFTFNNKNHYEMCLGYANIAAKVMTLNNSFGTYNGLLSSTYFLNNNLIDTTGIAGICDSADILLDKALVEDDSARVMVARQKAELLSYNNKKRAIVVKQNTALLGSSKNMQKQLSGTKSSATSLARNIKSAINSRNNVIKADKKDKSFYSKKTAPKTVRVDSITYAISIRIWKDTIKKIQKRLQKLYTQVDSIYAIADKRLGNYAANLPNITDYDYRLISLRQNFYDDLDYEIRKPKDTLIKLKFRNDSLLLTKKGFAFEPLFQKYGGILDCSAKLMTAYRTKTQMMAQMKGFCANGNAMNEQYKQTVEDLASEVEWMNKQDEAYEKLLEKLADDISHTKTNVTEEQRAYTTEEKTEFNYNRTRRNFISNHASGLTRTIRSTKGSLRGSKSDVNRFMKWLTKLRKQKKKK